MYSSITYDQEFDDLMMYLRSKYPTKLFDLEGIGKQMDLSAFSKSFYSARTTADVSMDANANVDDVSVIAYNTEMPKPLFKLNSLFILWKELKKVYGLLTANTIIEQQITGDFYINDLWGVGAGLPYSYYGGTSVTARLDDTVYYFTMQDLFDYLAVIFPVVSLDGYEAIYPTNLALLDQGGKWVPTPVVMRHKSHAPLIKLETEDGHCTIVTADHPVITDTGDKRADSLVLGDTLKLADTLLPISSTVDVSTDYAYVLGLLLGGFKLPATDERDAAVIRRLFHSPWPSGPFILSKHCLDSALCGATTLPLSLPPDVLSWSSSALHSLVSGILVMGSFHQETIELKLPSYALVQQLADIIRALRFAKVSTSFLGSGTYVLTYARKPSTPSDPSNKISKIELWDTPEYVYDVTTATRHFVSQGLLQHNCFNYATYDVALLGLPMIQKIKSIPPKYLYSFKSQVEQFTIIAANSTLGATGLADLLIVMAYYVDQILRTGNDAGFFFDGWFSDAERARVSTQLEELAAIIESSSGIDEPTREAMLWQRCKAINATLEKTAPACPEWFSLNVYKYVRETLVSFIYTINQPLRGNQSCFTNVSVYDDYFLDSLLPNYVFPDGYTPRKETVKRLQEIFMSTMNSELTRTPVTFPVTSACFSVDENRNIRDREFLKTIAHYEQPFAFMSIYSGETSTLSSCCFDGAQTVLIKDGSGVRSVSFEDLYNNTPDDFTIFHKGCWVKGRVIRLPRGNKRMYCILTDDDKTLLVTEDHLHPTRRGDVPTVELTTDDYLLVNSVPLPAQNHALTYEQGIWIGLVLRAGRIDGDTVTLALADRLFLSLSDSLNTVLADFDADPLFYIDSPAPGMSIYQACSSRLVDLIRSFIPASSGLLTPDVILESAAFRYGILAGLTVYTGDISLPSSLNRQRVDILCTSLGIPSSFYALPWDNATSPNPPSYSRVRFVFPLDSAPSYVYCFEMEDEPYFTLPNGIVTHNCRLRSSTKNEYINSFGAGSTKIGSLGVVCLNLPRLATKFVGKPKEEFFAALRELVQTCAKINYCKRRVVQKRITNGNHPLYSLGFINIGRQYSTVGINGFNECLEILGYDVLSDSGVQFGLDLIGVINDENDKMQKLYKAPHNVEQIPAENVSIKLAQKDALLGYNDKYSIYSNQFIPLTTRADVLDRIRLQGIFDRYFSGGAIAHINVEQPVSEDKIAELIEFCAKQGVVYWALNYNLQECYDGHLTVHVGDHCSICGSDIKDNYTRVVGFLTSVRNWHSVRREQDYPLRQRYNLSALDVPEISDTPEAINECCSDAV